MIDYANSTLEIISVHSVGNKTNGEEILLSDAPLDIADPRLRDLLLRFFMQPFSNPEWHNFTFTNEDFTLNPLYVFSGNIFERSKPFHTTTVSIARHLYELSEHPQIKPGDLFVALITDLKVDGVVTSAIGIFKSENRQTFLKLDANQNNFYLQYDDGINIEKMDKGCLIFDLDKESGYKICVVDKSNKSSEAQYWKDGFLLLRPTSDDYHLTKEFMNITKTFVAEQLPEEFEISRADQIDLLNRSVDYFKSNESFDKKHFQNEVLRDAEIIKSFERYDEDYRQTSNIELRDSFDISEQAVKKQAKTFKSVLKLDKNFHIYIHGDRELIEHGVDRDGRKYYKIYYEEEQ